MFLGVKEMEVRKIRFQETLVPGEVDFSDAAITQVTPLETAGTAELLPNTGGEVRIRGRLSVSIEAECDRCLGSAVFPLDQQFDLFYRPLATIARDEEVAIDEGEAEIGFYQGGGIELEDVLREQILLMLPMQRVCSAACKGICPVCGKNRNENPCDCHAAGMDDRWAGLRNL